MISTVIAMALSASSSPHMLPVTSPAFSDGQPIPAKYTCKGPDISPPLVWKAGPPGTRSYAIIVDDPDAPNGTFTHWVLFNLPLTELSEAAKQGTSGRNSFGNREYDGPCPPPGENHHYRFHVYALDRSFTDLVGSTTADALRSAIDGHVLAEGELRGTFQR